MKKTISVSVSQLFIMLFLSRIIAYVTFSTYIADVSQMWGNMASLPLSLIITLLMTVPVYMLYKQDKKRTITDNGYEVLGRLGFVVAVVYGLYFLWVLVYTLTLFNLFVTNLLNPTISAFVLSLAVVIAAVYGAYKGIEAISRASTIVLVIVLVAVIFMVCTLLPRVDSLNYTPVFLRSGGDIWQSTLFMIGRNSAIPAMGMLLPFVNGRVKKGICLWAFFSYLCIGLLILLIVGVLGDYISTQVFPMYTVTSIAGVGVLERLDGVFLGVWTAGMFIKISLFIYLLSMCVKRIFGDLASRVSILLCGALVLGVSTLTSVQDSWLGILFNSNVTVWLTLITGVLLPLLLLCIRLIKKKVGARHEKDI
ncbi:MAG TPA: GerAB/ArcD/ProY family transporter [Clostridiales bacterium]|nr:GerAB/ArcD/ProY family transporter [Clostridiales bacterium]